MIDLTTYALLRKQITSAASGVSDVRAEGDELVFVLADGHEVRVAIPATEIRDAVVRDDVLVLTLEDDKEVVVDATLTQSGQAADAKVTGDALALKLTEPSTGLAVGKYFRIAAIDESGHAVLEAVDGTGGLSTEPSLWPLWTSEEQAAARARTGAYHVDLIGTVETEEEVSSIVFDFEARSADRIITITEMPPVSIAKPMNIAMITDKGTGPIVQFGSGDQSTSKMRCFMSDTILLDRVAISHNGAKSTNTTILSGTESIFINDSIDKASIRSVIINNPVPLPIGTKVSLYMGA